MKHLHNAYTIVILIFIFFKTNTCKTYHIRPLPLLKIDFRGEKVYDKCDVHACNHRTHESETKVSSHLRPVWAMQPDSISKC